MTDQTPIASDDRRHPPLADPVCRFFAAVADEDPGAVAATFVPTGIVHDEGEGLDVAGSDAISEWTRTHLIAASVRLTPGAAELADGTWAVEVKVSGAFSGSPARSVMRFALDGSLVGELWTGTPR